MSAYPGVAVEMTSPGNLRPGWLADDQRWRDQLAAMGPDDVRWLERHWETAGGAKAGLDLSWVTTENVGDSLFWPVLFGSIIIVGTLTAVGFLLVGGGS